MTANYLDLHKKSVYIEKAMMMKKEEQKLAKV